MANLHNTFKSVYSQAKKVKHPYKTIAVILMTPWISILNCEIYFLCFSTFNSFSYILISCFYFDLLCKTRTSAHTLTSPAFLHVNYISKLDQTDCRSVFVCERERMFLIFWVWLWKLRCAWLSWSRVLQQKVFVGLHARQRVTDRSDNFCIASLSLLSRVHLYFNLKWPLFIYLGQLVNW